MKFGVILHKTTMNLGDDIQTYASMQHLPSVDYIVERENTDSFHSENNEPVAVIMSAWWMWQKWNWPPAECIVPKLVSMHMNNYTIYRKASPIYDEWLQGVGGKFFRENGPIGVRDKTSLDFFNERGFECYFSGCITLTLPQQKKTPDAGQYVCLVDLNPALESKARELLKDTGLEIRVLSHHCDYRKSDATFEERMKTVEDLLTQYQNAKFVITRRLHVSLPCLAMQVPVLSVVNMNDVGNSTRWAPYAEWLHYVADEDFKAGNFDYDFNNPPENKKTYLQTRENLTADIKAFVDEMKKCDLPIEQVKKVSYTEEEARIWQNELMHFTLEKWLHQNRGMLNERNKYKKQVEQYQKLLKEKGIPDDVQNEWMKKEGRTMHFCRKVYAVALSIGEKTHQEETVKKIAQKAKKIIKKEK